MKEGGNYLVKGKFLIMRRKTCQESAARLFTKSPRAEQVLLQKIEQNNKP